MINDANSEGVQARMVSASCVIVLTCILVAGLWPFHTPHNAVKWLENENGLSFGRHGAIMSASPFREAQFPTGNGCSLELWLTPSKVPGNGAILAFDSSPDPRAPFVLRQYGESVVLQRYRVDDQGNVTQPWLRVDRVFQGSKRVFVTITSDQSHTAVYVDGILAGTSSDPGILARELTGSLVLANSTVDDSWPGQISGLAIYARELSPEQVRNHFQHWLPAQGPMLTTELSPIAFYPFSERSGRVVHNLVDPATDLTVPANYFVLHPAFLRSTWDQYSRARDIWKQWNFWKDLAVNIVGFVPVGFVFFAYLSAVRGIRRSGLVVVLLGLFLSFTVEALQRLLPNRDSGMTDLFTNTAGTALGVWLYQVSLVRTTWGKILSMLAPPSGAQLSHIAVASDPLAQRKHQL
jgi:VanZ family protein